APTGPLGAAPSIGPGRTLEAVNVEVDGGANPTLAIPGGTLNPTYGLIVGNAHAGTLTMSAGAQGQTIAFSIGDQAGGVGTINLDGAGTLLHVPQFGAQIPVFVGNSGSGTLNITGGAAMTLEYNPFEVGELAGSHGAVLVSGPGSLLDTGDSYGMSIGRFGAGTLSIL